MTLYFEDLDIGDTWNVGEYTLTKDEIIEFAKQFDPQDQHIDEEAAEESMFSELVASGLHTLCLSTRLYVTSSIDIANMVGIGFDDVRWTKPVTPGDTISLEMEVPDKVESRDRQDRGYVDLGRTVLVGDDPVPMYVSHVIVC
jgi:acyl dehydratase